MPENDSVQGNWKSSYRILQSTDNLPLIFDYAWVMNGQYVFYILDANHQEGDTIASVLLTRALFHDYVRNLQGECADLPSLLRVINKGFKALSVAAPVRALFGIADFVEETISMSSHGLQAQWQRYWTQ